MTSLNVLTLSGFRDTSLRVETLIYIPFMPFWFSTIIPPFSSSCFSWSLLIMVFCILTAVSSLVLVCWSIDVRHQLTLDLSDYYQSMETKIWQGNYLFLSIFFPSLFYFVSPTLPSSLKERKELQRLVLFCMRWFQLKRQAYVWSTMTPFDDWCTSLPSTTWSFFSGDGGKWEVDWCEWGRCVNQMN